MFGLSVRVIWILVAIVFGVAEAATLSLTMVWFSIGALCALAVSYFTDSVFIQLVVFAVVSFSLLIFATKKLIKMDRDKSDTHWVSIDTNTDAVIGKKGFVIKDIRPQKAGLVRVKGEEWTAIASDEDESIDSGEEIVVRDIQGVKLIVEKKEN